MLHLFPVKHSFKDTFGFHGCWRKHLGLQFLILKLKFAAAVKLDTEVWVSLCVPLSYDQDPAVKGDSCGCRTVTCVNACKMGKKQDGA